MDPSLPLASWVSSLEGIMASIRALTPIILLLVLPRLGATQEHQHDHAPGAEGEIGRVTFPSSCAPAASRQLGGAVALLHSFWYEEAEQAFARVIEADPGCAFGYWGRAQSQLRPLWPPVPEAAHAAAVADAREALARSRPGTRERAWAEAQTAFFRPLPDPRSHADRLHAWTEAAGRVAEQYPEDDEARIFYALGLVGLGQLASTDTSYAYQRRAAALLEPVFARQPNHPGLAHYLIHAFDSPALARLAEPAARRYAEIAPAVPHAQHMPSHIFIRLGQWEDAIASNARSADAAREFERRNGWNAVWDQRSHAWDYMMYAYLQLGREREARDLVREAAAVTRVYPENSLVQDYALAAIPARYALERDRWDEAGGLAIRPSPAWPACEGITHFARTLGAARRGDAAAARAGLAILADLETRLLRMGGLQTYWAGQVKIQRLAGSAWLALLEGDTATAVRLGREAADLDDHTGKHPATPGAVLPARELYGDLLLQIGRPAEAVEAYEIAERRQPGRARTARGLARARELAGR